jgi:hypothetical protein
MAMFGEYDIRNTFNLDITLEFALRVLFINAQEELFTSTSTTINFHKVLDDEVTITDDLTGGYPGGEFKLQGTSSDSAIISEFISAINFQKLLNSSHYLYDNTTIDNESFSLTDSNSTSAASATNGKLALTTTKTLNNTHKLYDDSTIDDETFSITDNGGSIWLNPYASPSYVTNIIGGQRWAASETVSSGTTIYYSDVVEVAPYYIWTSSAGTFAGTAPALAVSAGAFSIGQQYRITDLGTTSQLQWNTIAGTSAVTYVFADIFTAADTGSGLGTGEAIRTSVTNGTVTLTHVGTYKIGYSTNYVTGETLFTGAGV